MVQLGHSEKISAAAFSLNGQLLATGGDGGEVFLWEVSSRRLLRSLKGHLGRVVQVGFRAQGAELITVGFDLDVRIWDTRTGRQIKTLKLSSNQAPACDKAQILAGGNRLATASTFGRPVTLWDLNTGAMIRQFNARRLVVVDFAFSPDEGLLAIASGNEVQIIDVATNQPTGKNLSHTSMIKTVKFNSSGNWLVTRGADDTVRLWDANTREELKRAELANASALVLMISPDDRSVMIFDDESDFHIWDLRSGSLKAVSLGEQSVYSAAFSPDGKTVVLGEEGGATLWDFASEKVLAELKGYGIAVEAVGCSPDGKYYATGGADGLVRVWELRTGREVAEFKGHQDAVKSVAFSPNSHVVASAGDDRTVRLWDIEGGRPRVLRGHDHGITSVSFSPDGKRLVTGSLDKTARLWNLETGDVKVLSGHSATVTSAAFAGPDGRLVITDTRNGEFLWDAETGQLLGTLEGHSSTVYSASFSADGKSLLTGCGDGIARLWEVTTGRLMQRFAHGSPIHSVSFSRDGQLILTAGGDKAATLWEVATGKPRQTFVHTRQVNDAAFSPDAAVVATASNDGTVGLWSTTTGQSLRRLPISITDERNNAVKRVSFSPNGKLLAAASDTVLRVWDANTLEEVAHSTLPDSVGQKLIGFSPDEKYIATILNGVLINVLGLRPESGFATRQIKLPPPLVVIESDAFSNDGKMLLGGYDKDMNSVISVVDLDTGNELRRITKPARSGERAVTSVAVSPDLKFAFAARGDAEATIYDTTTWTEVRALLSHHGGTRSIAVSPDGRYLLAGGGGLNNRVRLWDLQTRSPVRTFEGDLPYGASSIALSPNGEELLAGSEDGIARLWEVATGRALGTFAGHTNSINAVTFTKDGNYALTASSDGTTRLWNVRDARAAREVCSLISFADGVWSVVAPNGLFDTNTFESLGSFQWVLPEDPNRALPQEIFTRDFYRPGLLSDLLKGKAPEQPPALQAINLAQPEVTVSAVEGEADKPNTVSVTVKITEGKYSLLRGGRQLSMRSGAYDLRLFRDGHRVAQFPAGSSSEKTDARSSVDLSNWRRSSAIELGPSGESIHVFHNVPLPHRTGVSAVSFTAYAFNEDRVKSITGPPFVHRFSPSPAPMRPRAYIIMVGVGANQSGWDLSFAVKSASELTDALREKLGSQYEVISLQVISARELDSPNVILKQATKENIHAVFQLLAGKQLSADRLAGLPESMRRDLRSASPDDLVIFFISSHGYVDPKRNFYLVPFDTGPPRGATEATLNQCLSGSDDSARCSDAWAFRDHLISSNELSNWWDDIDADQMVMIIDSCYSGAVVGGSFRPGPLGDGTFGQLSYDKGMLILAAAQPNQPALGTLRVGTGRSLLADALIESPLNVRTQTLAAFLSAAVAHVPARYKLLFPDVNDDDVQLPLLLDFTKKR